MTSVTKGGKITLGKVRCLKLLIEQKVTVTNVTCSSSRQSAVPWVLLPFPNAVSTAAAALENCSDRSPQCVTPLTSRRLDLQPLVK